MAKKKMGWDFDDVDAKESAKSSIKKTTKQAPKKRVGRPREVSEQKLCKVQIYDECRILAKKVSVLNDTTMTDYISELIKQDAKKKGIK